MDNPNPTNPVDTNYIETIKKLKAETVSRDEYEKLRSDNQKLLDSLINGATTESPPAEPAPKYREPDEIRKELFAENESLSNLDFATKTIELRNTLLAKGETDPFLPVGENISASREDVESANRVADVLQQCIDVAEGDNSVFTNELQRRTKDVRIR